MNTFNNDKRKKRQLGWGIFLLVLGALFLLKNAGLFIPFWILSWHTILLVIGFWFGYRKQFRAGGWVLMVLIGGIFTLKDVLFFDISSYTTALVCIGLGLYLILKPKRQMHFCDFGPQKRKVDFEGSDHP